MKTSLAFYTIWKKIPRLVPRYSRYLSSPISAQYEAVSQGQEQLPEYFNFASDVLDKWTQIEKDGKKSCHPALWWINGRGGEVRWSFEEMGFHSRKVANILTDRCGLRKGDRILVILSRIPEWWLVMMACIRTGIVAIPATSQLTAKDIEYRLQASGAKCLITTEALGSTVDSIAPRCTSLKTKLLVSSEGKREGWLNFDELLREAPADHTCAKTKMNDPMLVYFTSGTTGVPKMVEHTQGSLGFRPLISQRSWLSTTSSDLVWGTADTSWVVAAIGSFFDPWVLGSCVFIHNLPMLEKTTILRTLSQFPINAFVSLPTFFRMILREDFTSYKFKNLQYCISGGEPLDLDVMEQWKNKTGLDIYELYGQTEAGSICSISKEMKIKPGSMGKAVFPYDVQIVDEEANILPPGKEGEIAIRIKPQRPLGLFTQYINAPEKTAATLRGDFFVTGDRGVMDEDGYFRFIGRADDIIKSSGYRIGPFEVESVLLNHPAVAEVAAVNSPDPIRGEVVKVFVVLSTDYATHNKEKLTVELQEHVKKMTAPYKYPRKLDELFPMVGAMKFLSRLPRLQAAGLPTFPCRFNSQTTHAFTSLANLDSEPRDRNLPEYFNFASDVLDKWSQREKEGKRPSNPALWWVTENDEEVKWTFEELSYLSRKTATVLSEACNLRKGDRLLMILPRVPEWWLLSLACIRTGIVFIPATILLTAPDILYRLQQSKVSCIVANEATAPFVDAVGSECSWLKTRILVSKTSKREGWLNFHDLLQAASDRHQPIQTKSLDPMTIYFTSGTMGYPKMVQHSQSSLGFGLATTAREWMGLTSSDIIWGLSDPGWIKFAVGSFYSPWSQGSCIFQHGFLQFDPKVVLETLAKYPVTTFCGTPTIFRMLLQHDVSRYKFKSLQTCLSGGEPSNLEELKVWKEETGLDIHEGYGQTESSILCSTGKGMKIKPGFIGKPLSDVDLQIIDENNNRLPPGEEGDIAVKIKPQKPVGLFSGYVNDPEKTAGTERGDYYITGDRGLMDEDGYIQFTARADDIILSSGYRIGPFEVEHALMKHPAVAEAAVVSSPDPIRGEVVKAFIILTPAYQSRDREKLSVELQGHVKKITAPYKYPRKIEFVQDLPKTVSGKIQKRLLRKKEWEKD